MQTNRARSEVWYSEREFDNVGPWRRERRAELHSARAVLQVQHTKTYSTFTYDCMEGKVWQRKQVEREEVREEDVALVRQTRTEQVLVPVRGKVFATGCIEKTLWTIFTWCEDAFQS